MGWYRDRRGSWRYCENPMHNHCYSTEGSGPSAEWIIIYIIFGILSIPTVVGPIIFLIAFIQELSKKEDPTKPKHRGVPSGWCR